MFHRTGQTTDVTSVHEHTPATFYDWLASDYDAMTGFDERFSREVDAYQTIVKRYGISTAIDAGCGTGFLALLLAKLGLGVTAVDISRNMLAAAQRHAREMGLDMDILESSFLNLPDHIRTPVDGVFSMGNSLSHVRSTNELLQTLRSFRAVLRSGGVVFLHMLNFDRLVSQKERIQNVREVGNIVFVRFYDYLDGAIRFNILALHRTGNGIHHDLQSVMLHPIPSGEILKLLDEAGFNQIALYAGPSLEPYKSGSSRDLMAIAVAV